MTETEAAKAPKGPIKVSIGDTVDDEEGGSITAHGYRVTTDTLGKKVGAVDIEVCLGPDVPAGVEDAEGHVTTDYWSAVDKENRRYQHPGEWSENKDVSPVLDPETPASWGDCVRGWALLETNDKTDVTEIRYYRPKDENRNATDIRWAVK
ncbi:MULTISPECIES: hypothetical protein [unclassified Brevibacterium]|uniref:hypothetical protein n=1 Tax=unclassified Brevibacterium TaxID=2614124 RepID=UPI0008A60CE8|nr:MULTISPECIES: hypothetical protein [unclassified Brevibacterium]OFL64177.1 hypothetical protein HMPREF2757_01585 [Brevibacterium sp. HMSC063G07]OFS26413.1 hypothetical protein HMPREF3162_06465 [Brevibacterium sp. HMSC07C04]